MKIKIKISNYNNITIVNLIILTFFLITSISCKKYIEPDSPEKLFEKYKSSVVLIACQYYFEVEINNVILFYSPDTEKKLFFSKEEVLDNLSFSTGTGFVISNKGEIITNNHVVNRKDESYKIEFTNFNEKIKESVINELNLYNDTIVEITRIYRLYYDDLDYEKIDALENKYELLNLQKDNLLDFYKVINNIDINNSNSKIVIYKLGIAYNDTHVTEFDDLQECVVIKTSNVPEVDLAIIQTKSKSFNNNSITVFNFEDNNPNIKINPKKYSQRDIKNPISINEDVYMIGFNKGFTLAKTNQGIKSQFTSGKISQENDGERILYTIPTLEGSSGSPIIDKWGNLVAVNFAKINNSQGFSFGVPISVLKNFYEE